MEPQVERSIVDHLERDNMVVRVIDPKSEEMGDGVYRWVGGWAGGCLGGQASISLAGGVVLVCGGGGWVGGAEGRVKGAGREAALNPLPGHPSYPSACLSAGPAVPRPALPALQVQG
jgi:hypothetical protein